MSKENKEILAERRKKYFHEYEKEFTIEKIKKMSEHKTKYEQQYCCICGALQTYSQVSRKRKTCGKNTCIQAVRAETNEANKAELAKMIEEIKEES